jgi:hypothetical protein
MRSTILDVIMRVEPSRYNALQTLLQEIASDVCGNSLVPFASVPSIHFSSIVLFESPAFGTYLVWEHNFDGTLNAYLDLLLNAPGIDDLLSCCAGYSPTQRRTYVLSHIVRPSTYHIGAIGRDVGRIRSEAALRDRLQSFLDTCEVHGRSADAIRKDAQAFVDGQPDLAWAKEPQPRQQPGEQLAAYAKIGIAGSIALVLSPLLLIGLILIRWRELHDQPATAPAPVEQVRQLLETENFIAQNHLASMTIVKPGGLRLWTVRLVLFAANLLARISVKGELSGIPTIHFAHWTLIDDGKRLLFLSNYGGSWSSYLDDFIDKAGTGLTGIWSNTVGFPKTRFLLFGGARDGTRFKAYARASQSVTRVWYSAYEKLTVTAINNNSAIREGLYQPVDAKEWLRRF